MSLTGVEILLFAKEGFDSTDSVISTLNNNKTRNTESGGVAAATNKASSEMRLDNREATEPKEDFAAAAVEPRQGSDPVQDSTGSTPSAAPWNGTEAFPARVPPEISPKDSVSPTRANVDAEPKKYYWIAAIVALIAAGMAVFKMREQRA
jgi:hypothetical protein